MLFFPSTCFRRVIFNRFRNHGFLIIAAAVKVTDIWFRRWKCMKSCETRTGISFLSVCMPHNTWRRLPKHFTNYQNQRIALISSILCLCSRFMWSPINNIFSLIYDPPHTYRACRSVVVHIVSCFDISCLIYRMPLSLARSLTTKGRAADVKMEWSSTGGLES
jgi:hypothetical protein